MSHEQENDPVFSMLSRLPREEPDSRRAAAVRERCRGNVHARQSRRSASMTRVALFRSFISDPLSLIFKRIPNPELSRIPNPKIPNR